MHRRIALCLLVASLLGCTSMAQVGMDQMNSGQYQAAFNTFSQCAQAGDSDCINNIGYMYQQGFMEGGPNVDQAVRWYSLAARYGNITAQQNLVAMGAPVPPMDLLGGHTAAANAELAQYLLIQSAIGGQ